MLRIIAFVLVSCILVSCEKVIELDLEGVEKKYVIEGVLSDRQGMPMVRITQTKDFGEDNQFPGLSGAEVSITESASGERIVLTETGPGIYQAEALSGTPGKTYLLEVRIGEEYFRAQSTMPAPVDMESVFVSEENIFGEVWKLANISFQEPGGTDNYYRFIQYINGRKTEQTFIRDDHLVDGKRFETKLYMDPDIEEEYRIKSGDELLIEMQCIDEAVYKYWFSLEQGATGDGGPVTPANPASNIEGGALGYFSAHSTKLKSITVP